MLTDKVAVAYHGWGFDHTCWQTWVALWAQRQITLQVGDRGYFGNPVIASGSPKIILAHSYGLHLCPLHQLQHVDLLILFGSFLAFHPQREPHKRRSIAMLNQMITQFKASPQTVLETFRAKCYYPAAWTDAFPPSLNANLLLQDLEDLNHCVLDLAILKAIPKVLILHGAQDRIVPSAQGRNLFAHLADNSQYREVDPAGHGLPFTHAAACWDWICQSLDER